MKQFSWILGFVGGLGVLAFLAYAAFVDTIETPYAVAGGIAVALVVAWIALDWAGLSRTAQARGTRYSLNATLLVVVVGGIAVALNVLAQRYDERIDLTASQRFALSEQTGKVLAGLEQDVRILGFFPAGSLEEGELEDLVDGYLQQTDRVTLSLHDPLREPLLAEQNDIQSTWGTVIVKVGEQTQRLESDFGEEALTNAIIRATSGTVHSLCVTTGHGELDPQDSSSTAGLGLVTQRLEAQNYTVKAVNLVREGAVPDDCEVVVVPDPQTELLAPEREMLAAHVADGDAMLVLLDPTHAPAFAADLDRYGIRVGEDIILEANPNYQLVGGDATYLVLDPGSFTGHPITDDIEGMTILRVARSVGLGSDLPGIKVELLARTTPYGWAETRLDGLTEPQPDDGDIVGNVPLMALAEVTDPAALRVGSLAIGHGGAGAGIPPLGAQPEGGPGEGSGATDTGSPGTQAEDSTERVPPTEPAVVEPSPQAEVPRAAGGRVLVIGDSDFASNELVSQGSNQDLYLNALAWMVGEEDQVSIRPNPASTASLTMDLLQGLVVWLVCLLLVPGIAIGMAIGTWRRRRAL